jgi:two-component system sensor histidine kinase/response regulator
MTPYEQRRSLLESSYRKPGVSFPEPADARGIPEAGIQDAFDDLQHSKEQLREHTAVLEARNRDLEAYAHMVTHDLKDPLALIVITSDLITGVSDLTPQELGEYLGQIRSTAYEMDRIINSLLLFAEVSKSEAPVEPVDMAWVVANVRDRLGHLIEEHRAQIDLPEVWPGAFGYAPWIEEVWANYLSNALKHGGQPPRVELGASAQPDGMVRFWTRDNGPGLPPDAGAGLFTPFSQLGSADNPGHGLGLSIAHRIVEKLGGQVGVECEVGQGSLFFFTLPGDPSSA